MAQRSSRNILKNDIAKWNFAIFLTLAFMLIVAVTYALNQSNFDIRSRASSGMPSCVNPVYPADWKAQKAHCLEVEQGEFRWDVDYRNCRLVPVCGPKK